MFGVVDWSSNLPCEEPKGKRLKLPIAGMSSTVYPDYAGILAAQLGDTSFGPTVIASGANSADVSALIDREPALVSATAGLEAEGAVDVPPPRKRRKKTKSATKPRADPPLDGDDGDGARSPRMRRGDDGIDGDREGVRMESSASPAGGDCLREVERPVRAGRLTGRWRHWRFLTFHSRTGLPPWLAQRQRYALVDCLPRLFWVMVFLQGTDHFPLSFLGCRLLLVRTCS